MSEHRIAKLRLSRQSAGTSLFGRPKSVWVIEYLDGSGTVLTVSPTRFPGNADGAAVLGAVRGTLASNPETQYAEVFISPVEPESEYDL